MGARGLAVGQGGGRGAMTANLLTPDQLEAALRAIGAERYHNRHPFHKLLHGGKLDRGQVQAWALNRFYYQRQIPIKDAAIIARLDDAGLRRAWRTRLVDHDGDGNAPGGIERWLKLAEGVGLDRTYVESTAGILPTTRFAVDAYVHFVRDRTVLEAIASSLTELFAPTIIAERVEGMVRSYPFITLDTLAYFKPRLTQAPREVLIVVCAAHRAAAFDACRYGIDTLKRTVPIWKKEFFKDGAVWAEGETPTV